MKKILAILVFGSLLVAYGCPHDVYEIEMEPKDQQLERVTYYHPNQQSSDSAPATKPITSGLFSNRLPDDVKDGYGRFVSYKTDLGTAYIYVERFRGNDDIVGLIDVRLKACDLLADMTIKWAGEEFTKSNATDKLLKYAKGPFRADLKNVCTYLWLGNAISYIATTQGANVTAGKSAQNEIFARIMLYLVERGYLTQNEVPAFMQGNSQDLLLRTILVNKAGLNADEAKTAADPELFRAGIEKLFAASENRFAERLEELAKQAKIEIPKDKKDKTRLEMTFELAIVGQYADLEFSDPEAKSVLKTSTRPVDTNGLYDENEKTVKWELRFPHAQKHLPAVAYALWAVPDEKFQKDHLGAVLLTGGMLYQYCLWENSLDETKLKAWREIVRNLSTEKSPQEQLDQKPFKGATIILEAIKQLKPS